LTLSKSKMPVLLLLSLMPFWRKGFTFLVLVFLFVKVGWISLYIHWCSKFTARWIYPTLQELNWIAMDHHPLSGYGKQ